MQDVAARKRTKKNNKQRPIDQWRSMETDAKTVVWDRLAPPPTRLHDSCHPGQYATLLQSPLLVRPPGPSLSMLGVVRRTWQKTCLHNADRMARPFRVGAKVNLHHLLSLDDDKEHFKVVFDLALHWKDTWLHGTKSDVFLVNGRRLSGIVRRELDDLSEMDRFFIVNPCGCRSAGVSDSDFVEASPGCESCDCECCHEGVELECPGTMVHHVETPSLKHLPWSPLNKFTIGTVPVKEEIQVQSEPTLVNGMTGEVRVFTKYIAEFTASMDMSDFPFDRHKLSFNVTTAVPSTEMVFIDLGTSQCRIEDRPGAAWELDRHKQECDGTLLVRSLPKGPHGPREGYSQCIVQLFVKRKPGFYIHNYVFLLFIMTLLSFTAFAVPITDVPGRGGITVTMFLTVVSFKLLMSQQLPKKPYVTQMESYVISAFVLVCIPMLGQVALLFLLCTGDDISLVFTGKSDLPEARIQGDGYDCDPSVKSADRQLMVLLGAIWIWLHTAYGLLWLLGRRPQRTVCGSSTCRLFFVLQIAIAAAWTLLAWVGKRWFSEPLFEPWGWLCLASAGLYSLYIISRHTCLSRKRS
eukprot:TRINITY_DN18247_c0_g1_i1.p1 TRINITY_DN18247_c0_g1~~TRINITY_DN18247_c0_g1_i1.p1  ORF type:complete len:579 (+),score=64.10 TRINITY_DN18247_c0_g1_i1:67-1803(+)